jgi:hypothetical protein
MLKKLLDEALLVKLDVLIVASLRLSHARFFFFRGENDGFISP